VVCASKGRCASGLGPSCKPKRKIRPVQAATFLSSLVLFPQVSGSLTGFAGSTLGCCSTCPLEARVIQHLRVREFECCNSLAPSGFGNQHRQRGPARQVILPSTIGNNPIIVSPVASSTFQTCRFCLHERPICIPHHPSLAETAPEFPVPPRNSIASLIALTTARTTGSTHEDAGLAKTEMSGKPYLRIVSFPDGTLAWQADRFRSVSLGRCTGLSTACVPCKGVAGLRQSVSRHKQSRTPFLVTHAPRRLCAPCICPSEEQTQAANQRCNTPDQRPNLFVRPQIGSSFILSLAL